MEEFLERFPEVEAVIFVGLRPAEGVGTERPVQRPKDPDKQKEHYSGKKKRHTRKHIAGSSRQKRVLMLTKAREGTVHDKCQLEDEGLVEQIPDEVAVEGDLAFWGLHKE
jgi:DDE superfamily endonuclease